MYIESISWASRLDTAIVVADAIDFAVHNLDRHQSLFRNSAILANSKTSSNN